MKKYFCILFCAMMFFACSELFGPHELSFTENDITPWLKTVKPNLPSTYSFYLYTPPGYGDVADQYPLLVFLHGWGNFGTDPDPSQFSSGPLWPLYDRTVNGVKMNGVNDLNEHVRESFVIYPRLPYGYAGEDDTLGYWHPDTLMHIIDYIRDMYPIDDNRLYVTGLSYGGGGTWKFGLYNHDLVAAIVPVCAAYPWGEQSTDTFDLDLSPLKNVPMWDFVSFDDGDAGYPSSLRAKTFNLITGIDNIMAGYPNIDGNPLNPADGYYTLSLDTEGNGGWTAGVPYPSGSINYTLYDYGGHDAWTRTYSNDTMWDWLYDQRRE